MNPTFDVGAAVLWPVEENRYRITYELRRAIAHPPAGSFTASGKVHFLDPNVCFDPSNGLNSVGFIAADSLSSTIVELGNHCSSR